MSNGNWKPKKNLKIEADGFGPLFGSVGMDSGSGLHRKGSSPPFE